MTNIRAQDRFFTRVSGERDPDGFIHFRPPEWRPGKTPEGHACSIQVKDRVWDVSISPSGQVSGRLITRHADGSTDFRALRRIEETHLLKFCIR